MRSLTEIKKNILRLCSSDEFNGLALDIFHIQAKNNPVYRQFIHQLGIDPKRIISVEAIPFLPISFFKTHRVITGNHPPEIIFLSSGTSGMQPSRHEVVDLTLYESSFLQCFEQFYGKISYYCFLALLPSYNSKQHSSLIYMVDKLIARSQHQWSGFYLDATDKLLNILELLKMQRQPTILLGVSYALLDLTDKYSLDFPELIVIETGGMKGRRKEMIREELHQRLTSGLGVPVVHSEYGMTELLSQAYSQGKGIYHAPPWMKILIRDTNDPLTLIGHHQTGEINIIDLANVYSCSFLATQDLGKAYPDGSFEVLGRFDNSDVRGCNLLV